MLDTCLTMLRVLPSTVPLRIAGSNPLSHSTGAAGATAIPVFLLPWWSRPISAATLSTVLNSGCCKCSISTGCLCFAFWLVDIWRPGVGSGCQILMPYTPEYHNPTVSTVELQMTMNHFEGGGLIANYLRKFFFPGITLYDWLVGRGQIIPNSPVISDYISEGACISPSQLVVSKSSKFNCHKYFPELDAGCCQHMQELLYLP